MKRIIVLGMAAAVLAACASDRGPAVEAAYGSEKFYRARDCTQLTADWAAVEKDILKQKEQSKRDVAASGVSILFMMIMLRPIGAGEYNEELRELSGQVDAIEAAARYRNCNALINRIEQDRREAQQQKIRMAAQ